jgi:hypothetical protein
LPRRRTGIAIPLPGWQRRAHVRYWQRPGRCRGNSSSSRLVRSSSATTRSIRSAASDAQRRECSPFPGVELWDYCNTQQFFSPSHSMALILRLDVADGRRTRAATKAPQRKRPCRSRALPPIDPTFSFAGRNQGESPHGFVRRAIDQVRARHQHADGSCSGALCCGPII